MIKGYVINEGRGKHIFKRAVFPGMKVPLQDLYDMYKSVYKGKFDIGFLEWLEQTKIPKNCGFDIVVEEVGEDTSFEDKLKDVEKVVEEKLPVPNKLTAAQIADLKIKDNPKVIIQQVMSPHKLRRALTLCKGRKGKETLLKYIKVRLTELS